MDADAAARRWLTEDRREWQRRAMPTVETVRGPVDAGSLGTTLAHEHVFVLGHETRENFGTAFGGPWWDEEERVADAVRKLGAVGGRTTCTSRGRSARRCSPRA